MLISRASQEGFGLYWLVFTLWVFGGEAHNSLISTPQMLRLPHLHGAKRERFNGSLLVHQLGLSALLIAGLSITSLILHLLSRAPQGAHFASSALVTLMAAISIGPIALRNFARNTCFAQRDGTAALALDLGVSIIQLGGIWLMWYHGTLGRWWIAVLIIAAANLTSAAIWFATSRKQFKAELQSARLDLNRNWRISRYIFLSSMLWVAGIQLYPWLILHFAGAPAAGIWGACFALASLGNPLAMGIQNWMGPAIAHAHADRDAAAFRAYVFRCSIAFIAIVLPACLALAIFAEFLLTHTNGGTYAGNGKVTAILAFTLFLQGVSFPVSRALFSLGKAGLDMAANVGPLIVLAVFGAWLVSRFGVVGAASSLLAAQFVGSAIRVAAFLIVSRDKSSTSEVFAPKTLAAAEVAS